MITKQISASVLFFPLYLGVAPLAASAAGVDGASAGLDTITGTAWDTLESVTVTPVGGVNAFCMVVCSADAENPPGFYGIPRIYHLAVTYNQTVVAGSDRQFDFERPVGFPTPVTYTDVSTTAAFHLTAGAPRTIACSARKNGLSDPDMNIGDSSMSIKCEDSELQNNPSLPYVP